jgi:formylglycine-generating enzyme
MDFATSFAASSFRKVLKGFEIGGIPYTDVQFHLKRLLDAGTPPDELQEVLRRCELITPLPEYAHADVTHVIEKAKERAAAIAAQQPDIDIDLGESAPTAGSGAEMELMRGTLEAEQAKTQDMGRALAARIASEQAARARAEEARHEADQLHAELRSARHSNSERDTVIAKMRLSLNQSNAELDALQRNYLESKASLDSQANSAAQIQAELDASRAAFARLQRDSAQRVAETEALREALAGRDKSLAELQRAVAERDAKLPEWQSARSRVVALDQELKTARDSAADLERTLAQREAELDDSRAALERLQREFSRGVAETEALREALAGRDKSLAELQRAVAERDVLDQELKTARDSAADLERTLAQREAELDDSRAALESLQRDSTQRVAETEALREALAGRDRSLAELQRAVAERDALDQELKTAKDSAADLERTLAQREAELDDSRAVLESLQRDSAQRVAETAELQRAVAERDAKLTEWHGARSQADALDQELKTAKDSAAALQRLLAERDTNITSLHLEHERESSELHGARRRMDALERELGSARDDATPLRQERDSLRSQLTGLQAKLRDSETLIVTLQESVRSDARRVAELQAAAVPYAHASPAARAASVSPAPRWKPGNRARMAAAGAAIVVLAVVVWASTRHTSAPMLPAAVSSAPQAGAVLKDCPECPSLTVLPAGHFEQGAANGTGSFEKPVHAVAIAYPFAMSTNAVTVDEFRAFVAATGRNMQGCDIYEGDWRHKADSSWEKPGFAQTGTHPVTCASWNDAAAYAAWLSAKTGHHYRLPSASEWEYAARSGAAAVLPWADAASACSGANVADQSAARRFPGWSVFACDDGYVFTAPVGTFKSNTFGLNDMLGNVFQWTEDCWRPDYAGAPVNGSARTDGDCSERELRGGSWFSTPAYVRADYRNHFAADYRTSSAGIRLVRDIDS